MATILVVDDLPANRSVLVTLLRHHGHRLLEAVDGSQGLAAIRAERPDLVITDVLMPVMDGYELAKELRLDPATRGIPVVFYTARYGEREARALALASGVTDILTKPSDSAEVLEIVARVLAGGGDRRVPLDAPARREIDREHLRLVTDGLSEGAGELRSANARLRALVNIGLELASERDPEQLLESVCVAARELFGATYVTLGIVDLNDRTVRQVATSGTDAVDWIKMGDPLSGVLETVVAERRTVRGENSNGDPVGLQLPARHPDVQAFLVAPVASPDHVYGWFCLVGNDGRAFTNDDQDLVMALSGQIGRIYENRHFIAVAQKQAEALGREVLERQRTEAALRRERDSAQRYLDTAEVILLALDTDGRITLVNRYACSVLGWTADELIGRSWIETCLPAQIRDEYTVKLPIPFTGTMDHGENPVLTRSGEERLIEWRHTLLRDDAGTVVGSFSSGADITERNQALAAVRTVEERMRFALDNACVGIWDTNYRTGSVQWSDIVESQYGLERGTFGGTFDAFIECIHPEDRASAVETLSKAATTGAVFSFQHRSIWPDGTVRWLSGAGRIHLGEHGEPVRGVGISQDVTARHTLEEQYQQAQKMEAIGRLAGGVAHDFNNLLTVILGSCELLLADLGPDDPHRGDVGEIQKAGTSAAALTRQLLAFSRKQIIQPTLLDLNVVVAELRRMLERLIAEDVRIELDLGAPAAAVKADRSQVEQIIINLALNARDAMPNGGTLTIRTANADLDDQYAKRHPAVNPGSYVMLEVTDTGTGMTAAVQARLFEPFFTTKELGKGTGLGLATVHGIVTGNGGSIDVSSVAGQGSSFRAYFPAVPTADRA